MTLKGLPSTYNKDMQESWHAMLEGVKQTSDSVQIATGVLSTLTIFPERMKKALTPEMCATDLAEYLGEKRGAFPGNASYFGKSGWHWGEKKGVPMDQLGIGGSCRGWMGGSRRM